uniref:Uncharacterized protein n=1 Tax=Arundo donax TaxID=35708 RepID=A0A0A9EEU0_ARUDO
MQKQFSLLVISVHNQFGAGILQVMLASSISLSIESLL